MTTPIISKEEGNARLIKLAEFLQKLPDERFRYNVWVGDDWQGKEDLSCGTTACALGWAASIPAFQELGLHLWRRAEDSNGHVVLGDNHNSYSHRGLQAAEQFFNLTYEEAEVIFTGSNWDRNMNASRQQVIAVIYGFVAGRSAGMLANY